MSAQANAASSAPGSRRGSSTTLPPIGSKSPHPPVTAKAGGSGTADLGRVGLKEFRPPAALPVRDLREVLHSKDVVGLDSDRPIARSASGQVVPVASVMGVEAVAKETFAMGKTDSGAKEVITATITALQYEMEVLLGGAGAGAKPRGQVDRVPAAASPYVQRPLLVATEPSKVLGAGAVVPRYVFFERQGGTLEEWLATNAVTGAPQTVDDSFRRYALCAARGLQFLHGVGAVHRDVKPANVLIRARRGFDALVAGTGHTRPAGTAAGRGSRVAPSPYDAPEVLDGRTKLTAAADMWAFGMMLLSYHQRRCGHRTPEAEAADQLQQLIAGQKGKKPDERAGSRRSSLADNKTYNPGGSSPDISEIIGAAIGSAAHDIAVKGIGAVHRWALAQLAEIKAKHPKSGFVAAMEACLKPDPAARAAAPAIIEKLEDSSGSAALAADRGQRLEQWAASTLATDARFLSELQRFVPAWRLWRRSDALAFVRDDRRSPPAWMALGHSLAFGEEVLVHGVDAKPRSASDCYLEALKLDRNSSCAAAAWAKLGDALIGEGKLRAKLLEGVEASPVDCYAQALQRDASLADAWANLAALMPPSERVTLKGNACLSAHGKSKATKGTERTVLKYECFDEALSRQPSNYRAWTELGKALLADGAEAVAGGAAVSKDVARGQPTVTIGGAGGGTQLTAVDCLIKALEHHEAYSPAWNWLGQALSDPDSSASTLTEAAIRRDHGKAQAAKAKSASHVAAKPVNTVCVGGKFVSRRECYLAAVRCDPMNSLGWNNLGNTVARFERNLALLKFNKRDLYVEALRHDPLMSLAWSNLGNTMAMFDEDGEDGEEETDKRRGVKKAEEKEFKMPVRGGKGTDTRGWSEISVPGLDAPGVKNSFNQRDCFLEALRIDPHCASAWNGFGTTIAEGLAVPVDVDIPAAAVVAIEAASAKMEADARAAPFATPDSSPQGWHFRPGCGTNSLQRIIDSRKTAPSLSKRLSARDCFLQALHCNPSDPASWSNLGTTLKPLADNAVTVNPAAAAKGAAASSKACPLEGADAPRVGVPCLLPGGAKTGEEKRVALRLKGMGVDGAMSQFECYAAALRLDETFAPAWFHLSMMMRPGDKVTVNGKVHTIVSCLETTLKYDPDHGPALTRLGDLGRTGDLCRDALPSYVEAVAKNPKNKEAWFNLGAALKEKEMASVKGQHVRRRDCYMEVLKIDISDYRGWARLGNTLGGAESVTVHGKTWTNRDCYREALRLDESCALAWYNMGLLLGEEADDGKKEPRTDVNGVLCTERQCYLKALEGDDTCAAAWYNLGTALGEGMKVDVGPRKKMSELDCYVEALKHNPADSDCWANLGGLLEDGDTVDVNGHEVTERDCYMHALRYNPSDSVAWCNLGTTLNSYDMIQVAGDEVGRKGCFVKAILLDGNNGLAWENLADCLLSGEMVAVGPKMVDADKCRQFAKAAAS